MGKSHTQSDDRFHVVPYSELALEFNGKHKRRRPDRRRSYRVDAVMAFRVGEMAERDDEEQRSQPPSP